MNSIRLAAVAAALASPLLAAAAPRASSTPRALQPAPVTETKPRPAPAPAAPAPAPAPAPALAEPDSAAPEWQVGPSLGVEFGMGDLKYSAPEMRIEATRALRRVSPVTTLSFVGSLSVAHASGKEDFPIVVPAFPVPVVRSVSIDWDANVFELVPAARLTYVTTPKVSFFADGGVGLTYTVARVHLPPAAASLSPDEVLSDGVGAVLRLAGGVVITPTPSLRIGLEVVGLHVRFGDGPGTGFALGASLTHRL